MSQRLIPYPVKRSFGECAGFGIFPENPETIWQVLFPLREIANSPARNGGAFDCANGKQLLRSAD